MATTHDTLVKVAGEVRELVEGIPGAADVGFDAAARPRLPAAEVRRPLATVVIGGIITATFLTLVLLPTLYCWFERENADPVKINAAKPEGAPA